MQTIGRYIVKKKIGSGSQGIVYLCEDPKLKRLVAIKLLHSKILASGEVSSFESEAQSLGRFQHQNIVSVYDFGYLKERPYIVFEYVEGQLLSDWIDRPTRKQSDVLKLITGIVAGISKAHQAGVVHRDIKPKNIIINDEGLAKIMDFGMAPLLDDQQSAKNVVGAPQYMAPEYLRNQQVSTAIDVFALGAIFYRLLTGHAAYEGDTTAEILASVMIGPPSAPSVYNSAVDDKLDSICLKALAANPIDRFPDAQSLLNVLEAYADGSFEQEEINSHGKATLEFLYRRMLRKKDFPAMADSIRSINQLQTNSKKDAEKLAAAIVRDFALTNKILKVVNSAYFGGFSGKISTVSRAIVVLGVDAVRSIAASLIFFEHMSNQAVAGKLKKIMASSLFRAMLAEQFATVSGSQHIEESFLCSMFYQLGEVLVTFYLPDEDKEIERQFSRGDHSLNEVVMQVIGVEYEKIGAFVAKQWNFPDEIIDVIQSKPVDKPAKPQSDKDRYRLLTMLSTKAVIELAEDNGNEQFFERIKSYQKALGFDNAQVEKALGNARENFTRMAEKMLHDKSIGEHIKRLQGTGQQQKSEKVAAKSFELDTVLDDQHHLPEEDAESILSQGLQEATNILLETGNVSAVFNTVLETLFRGMEFRKVLLCLQKGRVYTARLGFGDDIDEILEKFKLVMDQQQNVFTISLRKGVDVYIADVQEPKIHKDLPAWFFRLTNAGSFVLLPLMLNNRAVGFIYAEYAVPNQMKLQAKLFNLIKSLRNQMILVLKQNS